MVIQRWQSVLLFLATILMVAINFSPLAQSADAARTPATFVSDAPILLTLDILVAALLFISIFLFKNLRLQIRVTLLSILLICVLTVCAGIILYRDGALGRIEWTGAVLLLLCALLCALRAVWRMRIDRRLLRSADRLR